MPLGRLDFNNRSFFHGDVVLACSGDGLAVPKELQGVAGKGLDGGGQGFYGSAAEDESGVVVFQGVSIGFD